MAATRSPLPCGRCRSRPTRLPDPGVVVLPVVAVHGAQVPWGKVVIHGGAGGGGPAPAKHAARLPAVLEPERVAALASHARIRFRCRLTAGRPPQGSSYADSYCTYALSMSAGRSARSSRVAGHGLVQVAEGLLDAGVEVVRTPGAVRAWSCWFGRWLGQPCPGLVGDRAGLVAWGHSKQSSRSGGGESAMATVLGRGQGGRSGRRRDLGEFAAPGLSSCTFCLVPGRVDLRVT